MGPGDSPTLTQVFDGSGKNLSKKKDALSQFSYTRRIKSPRAVGKILGTTTAFSRTEKPFRRPTFFVYEALFFRAKICARRILFLSTPRMKFARPFFSSIVPISSRLWYPRPGEIVDTKASRARNRRPDPRSSRSRSLSLELFDRRARVRAVPQVEGRRFRRSSRLGSLLSSLPGPETRAVAPRRDRE